MAEPRIVVITGANRGIGRELAAQCAARGDTVVLGSRDLAAGEATADELAGELGPGAGRVWARTLDVTAAPTLEALAKDLRAELGRVDVLVNNAAIGYTWASAADIDLDEVREVLETNVVGAWRATQVLLPLLRLGHSPRIVMVSSESGSLASMGSGTPGYQVSKAALHALTRTLAADLAGDRILVNAVCPGWTATDMGGHGGRPVRDGAASVRWAVDLPDGGPSGTFARDGQPLPW